MRQDRLRDGPHPPPVRTDTPAATGTAYTCAMHPEVHGSGPSTCPKCGMALEPAAPAAPAARTDWVCPMHPQIVRSEPGTCPICGMATEPRKIGRASCRERASTAAGAAAVTRDV